MGDLGISAECQNKWTCIGRRMLTWETAPMFQDLRSLCRYDATYGSRSTHFVQLN